MKKPKMDSIVFQFTVNVPMELSAKSRLEIVRKFDPFYRKFLIIAKYECRREGFDVWLADVESNPSKVTNTTPSRKP